MALFFLVGAIVFAVNQEPVRQPINFNHSKHIENGLSCVDCHVGATTQAQATLPSLETCLMCHEEAVTESAEEEKLRTIAQAQTGLRWTQITRVPSHVYFSHRRHAEIAGLECATCHGTMREAVSPPVRPFLKPTMDACLSCHEKAGMESDCNDCHR